MLFWHYEDYEKPHYDLTAGFKDIRTEKTNTIIDVM